MTRGRSYCAARHSRPAVVVQTIGAHARQVTRPPRTASIGEGVGGGRVAVAEKLSASDGLVGLAYGVRGLGEDVQTAQEAPIRLMDHGTSPLPRQPLRRNWSKPRWYPVRA